MERVFKENSDDHRLRILDQKEKGFIQALNLGLQNSKGDFVARMDGDDISEKIRFQEQLAYIDETKSDLVGSWAILISEGGQELGKVKLPVKHSDIRKKIMLRNPILHPSIFFRKSIIDKVGNYNTKLEGAEDYDLYFRILAANLKISNVPQALIKLRETKDSLWRGPRWKKMRFTALAVQKNAIKNLGFNSLGDRFYYSISPLILFIPPKIAYMLKKVYYRK